MSRAAASAHEPQTAPRRLARRARRGEIRAAVADATRRLVERSPFQDLTIEEIAREAGVGRSSFYLHFRDKTDALLVAVERAAEELEREAERWWQGEGEPGALVREALDGATRIFRRHAALIRAAVEVSSYDDEVAAFWRSLVGRFADRTADHLRREQAAGRARALDPDATADAFCWMVERVCHVHLVLGDRRPRDVVDQLAAVWLAAVYGQPPPA